MDYYPDYWLAFKCYYYRKENDIFLWQETKDYELERVRVWKIWEKKGAHEYLDSSNGNMVSEKGHFVKEPGNREQYI